MALTRKDIETKIIQAKPQLLKILVLDVRLKARLQQVGVITDSLRNELEPQCLTPWKRVDLFLDDIMRGPVWRFLQFCRVMYEEGKPDVLEALNVDIEDIDNQLGTIAASGCPPPMTKQRTESKCKSAAKSQKCHYYKRIESEEMIAISNDLLPGLLQHCGSYNQSLMKTSLFGYKKNVPIDLTRIYVCQHATCKQNQREKLPVSKKELFLRLFGTRCPNTLSMEGPAGTGKSSYLEESAHDWSQDVTSCEQRGPDVACEGHFWKLVIYIAAGGIRGSADDAIRDNLRCEPHLKDQMMRDIGEDGEGVFITYDAMDELRHRESINSISSYIETAQKMVGKPKVLVSARDGLLSVERRYFDRELYLEGFSLPQGISYMKLYFNEMHSFSHHPVLQYVEAHPEDLEWVLSNPLRVHILSELTACGFLTLQDLKTLSTVKLFRSLDLLLCERDKERRPSSIQLPDFYQACLRCLFTDQRTLSEAGVGTESPYLSLLQRHDYMDQDFNDCCHYSFPHEMLLEYFSMRGLIECLMSDVEYKQGMLLWLCSNDKMRNVLQLTCGYIAQYEQQLLPDVVFIIRACLILQVEHVRCEENELTQKLLQLPTVVQETFPPNILTHGLTAGQATKLGEVSSLVQAAFCENADQLKETVWFLNSYTEAFDLEAHLSPLHKFLLGCLQQLTPQVLEDTFSQTINRLLPCSFFTGYDETGADMVGNTVVSVGHVRWAAVKQFFEVSSAAVNIYLWSPSDLSSTLNTWSQEPCVQKLLQSQHYVSYNIYTDRSAHSLCTSLPPDLWSEDKWTPGLRELLRPTYCTGEISVHMDDSITPPPLSGFLSACRRLITPGHGLIGGLEVHGGHVTEEELIGLCSWAGEVGLRLELWLLTVVLRAGRGKKDVKDVHSAIWGVVNRAGVGGTLFASPAYMTAGGELLCDCYDPNKESESEDSD